MLNGTFSGEIASNDTLIIGDRAVINADIRAAQANQVSERPGTRDSAVIALR